MYRVAVLYTGEIRTIEKTSPFFRKNILDSTNADIFATIQGSISCSTFESIIKEHWRDNLKSFSWFYREQYNELQDALIQKMDLEPRWKHYLKTSGSMIEYYQLYLSFQKMKEYEETNGFQYDYVIRLRTDVIVTIPIDLSFFKTPSRERLERVNNSVPHFFHSFFSIDRVLSTDILDIHVNVNEQKLKELLYDVPLVTKEKIIDYMNTGNYLITIRKNVFYIGKRSVFERISQLGITYGENRSPKYENWFDAESQLETICEVNRISIFDSMTRLEGESLYQYRLENYFNEKGELLDLPYVFCFICRH